MIKSMKGFALCFLLAACDARVVLGVAPLNAPADLSVPTLSDGFAGDGPRPCLTDGVACSASSECCSAVCAFSDGSALGACAGIH
jgi:hypothetical protein